MPKATQDCVLKQSSVLATTTPAGLPGVEFTLSPDGDVETSGPSGAVQFQGLEPGNYSVAAKLTGELVGVVELAVASKGGAVAAGQRLDLDFTARPTSLAVKISGPSELTGATVKISGRKDDSQPTDDEGLADFSRVPAGTYAIEVSIDADDAAAKKYRTVTKSSVDVALGKKVEHPVALAENPPFQVTIKAGAPDKNVDGVKVTITAGPHVQEATTGGDGVAKFDHAPLREHTIDFEFPDQHVKAFVLPGQARYTPKDGQTNLHPAVVEWPTALAVKISGPDKLDGATVEISGAKPDSKPTNAEGIADFGRVPDGHYDVQVTIPADDARALKYRVETTSALDLAKGKTVEHPVALKENPALEVTVLTKEPAEKKLENVKVKIKGGTHAQEVETKGTGIAKFDHLPLVEHTLDFELAEPEGKLYELLAQAKFTPVADTANATTIEAKPKACEVHLALHIKLPDDTTHALPKDLKAKLVASDASTQELKLNDKGVFVVASDGKVPLVKRTLKFSLELPKAADSWLVFEKPTAAATQELIVDADPKFDSDLCKKTAAGGRAILWLQKDAKLIEIDAAAEPADNFTKPDFEFKDKASIGEASAPVKLVLKPKWQYLRFEYFDRKHGKKDHGDKRVSIPPVILKASRKTTDGSLQDLEAGGNVVFEPSDAAKACQALPWIVTKKVADGADLPKLTKEMYFQFGEAKAWIEAKSKDERVIVKLDAAGADKDKVKPGKDRSKYYDLPKLWTSCFQLARGLDADKTKFFDELTDDEIDKSFTKTTPLKFSLDDIVLTDDAGAQGLKDKKADNSEIALSKHSRLAILHLDPDKKYNVAVWKPIATAVYHTEKGFTKDATDKFRNLLHDYPQNARAVLFCSGVHDIYDKRTETATFADKQIKGARAARLKDAEVSSPEKVFNANPDCFLDANFAEVVGGAGYVHKPRQFPMYYLHYGDTDGTTVYGVLLTMYSFRFFDNAHVPGAFVNHGGKTITSDYAGVRKYQDDGLKVAMQRWNGKGYQFEEQDDKTEFVIKPFYFFESKDVEDPLGGGTAGTINETGGKENCLCAVADGDAAPTTTPPNAGNGSWATDTTMYMRKSGYRDEGDGWGSNPPGSDPPIVDYDGTGASARNALAHELGHASVGLLDDYLTSKYPGSEVPTYAKIDTGAIVVVAQRYLGVPYNIDPVTIMSNNRAVRMRTQWGRALWLNAQAKTGKDLHKFVGDKTFRISYEPSDKGKLNYFLDTNGSMYKPAKQDKDANLGDNGKANLYLYRLGHDEFTAWMQNGPYDGMVILDWNLCVDFVNYPAPAGTWAVSTAYTVGAELINTGKSYRCATAYTSGATSTFAAEAGNWVEFTPVTWDASKKKTWIEDVNKRIIKEFEGDPNAGRFKLTSGGSYKKVYVRAFPQWYAKTPLGAPAGTHFTIKVTGNGKDTLVGGATVDVGNQVDANAILRYILGRYTASSDKKATLALADLDKVQAWLKTNTGGTTDYEGDVVPLSMSGFEPVGGDAEGKDVTIKGTNLSDVEKVAFGAVDQPTFTKTKDQITCKVPANAITAKIKLSSSNRSAESAGDFKVLPAITSFEPTAPAAVGAEVIINGTSLKDASAVKLGTVAIAATDYTVESATKIKAKVPATAVTAKLSVTTPAGTATSADDFKVIPVPTIADFNPKAAKAGADITITGAGLDGATAVKIGGAVAVIKSSAAGQIVATVGGDAANGAVDVTTPGGNVTKDGYTVVA